MFSLSCSSLKLTLPTRRLTTPAFSAFYPIPVAALISLAGTANLFGLFAFCSLLKEKQKIIFVGNC